MCLERSKVTLLRSRRIRHRSRPGLDLDEQWEEEGLTQALSAQTCIQNCVPKIDKMIGMEQFAKTTPFDDKHHSELDELPLCSPKRYPNIGP